MEAESSQPVGYVVPTYKAAPGTSWYHFLHGNVPGHQIDFMYRPEVPQEGLTRQHFSHLARLVKYIEPRHRSPYAFAIGNLSRDDTQYEPGHGAVALIFELRIRGAKDHAGRQDPPFCHAVAAADRHVSAEQIYATATAFYHQLLPDEESQAEGSGWYHTYVQHASNPDALVPLLRAYVADFEGLPAAPPSLLGARWVVSEGAVLPKRIVIVHRDRVAFEELAACAARIAGVLVESDVRWTVISNGREADVPGGVSVRFVPQFEAGAEAGDLVLRLEEVPESAEGIAGRLFSAQAAQSAAAVSAPRVGWRQRVEQQAADEIPVEVGEVVAGAARVGGGEAERRGGPVVAAVGAVGARGSASVAPRGEVRTETAKESRSQVTVLVGLGVALAVAGIAAVVALAVTGKGGEEPGAAEDGGVPAAATASSGEERPAATPTAPRSAPGAGSVKAEGSGARAPATSAPAGSTNVGASSRAKPAGSVGKPTNVGNPFKF